MNKEKQKKKKKKKTTTTTTHKCIWFWVRAMKDKKLTDTSNLKSKSDLAMYKSFNSLKMTKGLLYREVVSECEIQRQLILPSCFIAQRLTALLAETT